MQVKAKAKYIRMSPTKIRLVADLVRGLETNKALSQLAYSKKWAAKPVEKLVNSAVANAVNNFELDKNNLYIREIKVNEGPVIKRWMPKAFGRAGQILKRTSHIDLVLAEIKESGRKEAKAKKIEEPIKLGAKPKEDEGVKMKKESEEKEVETKEQGKKVTDSRMEGRHAHAKIEGGGKKGFKGKIFQRKSG